VEVLEICITQVLRNGKTQNLVLQAFIDLISLDNLLFVDLNEHIHLLLLLMCYEELLHQVNYSILQHFFP